MTASHVRDRAFEAVFEPSAVGGVNAVKGGVEAVEDDGRMVLEVGEEEGEEMIDVQLRTWRLLAACDSKGAFARDAHRWTV